MISVGRRSPNVFSRRSATGGSKQQPRRTAVLVTGMPGSGKTTLVRASAFPQEIAVAVTFSDLMDDVLRTQHPGKKLSNLWPRERAEVQLKVANRLATYEPKGKLLVIDGHLIVRTSRGWERGIPPEFWELISLVAIVIIHVPLDEMTSRYGDGVKDAELDHLKEQILVDQSLVRTTAAYYAASANRNSWLSPDENDTWNPPPCSLHSVINSTQRLDEAESELAAIVAGFGDSAK